MSKIFKIGILVGSLRKDSLNRKVARALTELAPPTLEPAIVEIRDLPLYDEDAETATPAPWQNFREAIRGMDAVLFVTPEYNRSVPAALKNALDVGSRPYGKSVWNKKPAAIVSASPGAIGAFGANHHLRQSLVFVNMPTMQQPEAYLSHADKLFDAEGKLANDGTRQFFQTYMLSFAEWIATTAVR